MKKNSVSLSLLAALAFSANAFSDVNGTITLSVDLSAHSTEEQARLWLPYPTSDAHQDITRVRLSGTHTHSAVYTDKTFGTPMLYAEWEPNETNRVLVLSFDAAREEITRPEWPNDSAEIAPSDHALFLRPTSKAPFTQELVALANEITANRTGTLEKARAIYDWTVENTWRDPETRGCGPGDVPALLKQPCGKCADISSIFIALCRASGVPAREVLGLRMGKTDAQDITKWQHCWAEFFLPGAGWISVDPADVRKKMLVEKLELSDPKTAEYREYFFGGVDAYRIKVGLGRDLKPNPATDGGSINYLMYPYARIGDETLDWLEPERFEYTITFTR